MSRLLRRILLLLTLVLFITIAPLVVLYAIGYRSASVKGSSGQVGVLLIETIPRNADIKVNEKPAGRTPEAVSNLPVGKAHIQITKAGYRPWEKTFDIEPARATEVNGIRLFPENPSQTELIPNTLAFNLSPNRSLLAALTADSTLLVRTTLGEDISPGIPLKDKPVQILWSPDSTALLIEYQNGQFELVEVSARRSLITPLSALTSTVSVSWDARVPGRIFALDSRKNLISHTIATGTSNTLIPAVDQFAVSSRNIFVISAGQLKAYTLQGQIHKTLALPDSKIPKKLLVTPAGSVALLTIDGTLLFLDENDQFIPAAVSAQSAAWSPDGNLLLIQTAHNELSVYNTADERRRSLPLGELRLVSRLSRSITQPQWFAGGHHIIYQVDDEIILTEIDTRDHPVSYTIDTTNTGSAGITVGEDGDIIYYLKKNPADGSTSLHSTSLLTEADSR